MVGGLDQGESSGGDKRSDTEYILKVELTTFVDELSTLAGRKK